VKTIAPPGYRFPYGHTHETQEEVYVVVRGRGRGRMKVDDEIVELREWDAVRVPPDTWRGYEAGAGGPRDPRHRRAQPRRGSARRRRWSARLVGRQAESSRRLIVPVTAPVFRDDPRGARAQLGTASVP
jgi:hypothetical protein